MKTVSLALIGLIFIFSTALFAIMPGSGELYFIVGGSHTLQSEMVEGSLVILFAQLSIDPEAQLEGGLIAFSSDVDIHGGVDGDILSLESNVDLYEHALLKGGYRQLDLLHVVFLLPEIRSTPLPY